MAVSAERNSLLTFACSSWAIGAENAGIAWKLTVEPMVLHSQQADSMVRKRQEHKDNSDGESVGAEEYQSIQ